MSCCAACVLCKAGGGMQPITRFALGLLSCSGRARAQPVTPSPACCGAQRTQCLHVVVCGVHTAGGAAGRADRRAAAAGRRVGLVRKHAQTVVDDVEIAAVQPRACVSYVMSIVVIAGCAPSQLHGTSATSRAWQTAQDVASCRGSTPAWQCPVGAGQQSGRAAPDGGARAAAGRPSRSTAGAARTTAT